MYAPTPPSIQTDEYRRQERLAHASQQRFIAEARRSGNAGTAQPRPVFALSYVHSLVASLASIALAMTTKQSGVSVSRDA